MPKPKLRLKKPNDERIAVIEGKWNKTNLSVKGFFDVLSDIHFGTPHGYSYEMFCDAQALDNIVGRMGQYRNIKYLYIGAHGSTKGISGSGGAVSRASLKNSLTRLNTGSIHGLFVGSCLFGARVNMGFLLNPRVKKNPPIKWIAGYTKSIDWMKSSVLDLLFWNTFLESSGTPIGRIEETANYMQSQAAGLINELGFCIYTRKKGPSAGEIQNLLER